MKKKIFMLIIVIVTLITSISIIRTKNYESTYTQSQIPEYDRYANERLILKIKLSPILFNYYHMDGVLKIGKDTYKIKRLIKTNYSYEDDDRISFSIKCRSVNEKETIDLVAHTSGSSYSEPFNQISINLITQSSGSGYIQSEKYDYEIMKQD